MTAADRTIADPRTADRAATADMGTAGARALGSPPLPAPPAGRIERFLFSPTDARTAAVFRVALAAMLAWAFWSVGARAGFPVIRVGGATQLYDQVFVTRWYALLTLAVAGLFGAGVRPRLTGLLLFALLLPLASLTRGQQSRQVLLFVLLAFSVLRSDARRSARTLLGGEPLASAGPIWPVRLIQIQLSLVYLINAIAKTTPQYLSGDVLIGMAQMRPNFLVDLSDGYQHVGPIAVPVAAAAVASVVIEYALAIGFWFPRLRWPTAVLGVAFHLGLQQIVSIFMLDYASMFLYLAFLLPWRTPRSTG